MLVLLAFLVPLGVLLPRIWLWVAQLSPLNLDPSLHAWLAVGRCLASKHVSSCTASTLVSVLGVGLTRREKFLLLVRLVVLVLRPLIAMVAPALAHPDRLLDDVQDDVYQPLDSVARPLL